MEALIKMIVDFLAKLLSLVGEEVPSFITDWVAGLGSDEDEAE